MLRYSRRQLVKLALAAPLAPALVGADSSIRGVVVGLQSYSFRDRTLDAAIQAMAGIGLSHCELWAGHVEPRNELTPEQLRKWRQKPPLELFRSVRKRFDAAGMTLTAYSYSFRDDSSDEEIASGLQMAKALGVAVITSSSNVGCARRIDAYASRAGITVGLHNHSRIAPDEFATPEDLERALKGASPYLAINLDIGHFVAAGFDPLDFIRRNHRRIVALHLKDRKKNQGPDMLFGQGDTPIREVLRLMMNERYRFPALIEYEVENREAVGGVRECFEFCRRALA